MVLRPPVLSLLGILLTDWPGLHAQRIWKIRADGELGRDCQALSFQAALHWKGIAPGDEIWVFPGRYSSLSLSGGEADFTATTWRAKDERGEDVLPQVEGANPVVIDAEGGRVGLSVPVHGCSFTGFEIRGAKGDTFHTDSWGSSGIWITASGVLIRDCLIRDCESAAIALTNHAAHNTIRHCILANTRGGILESGGQGVSGNLYEDNTIMDSGTGIHIEDAANESRGVGNVCWSGPVLLTPSLSIKDYASSGWVRAFFDLTHFGMRESMIFTAEVVDQESKPIRQEEVPVQGLKGQISFPVPQLPEGRYKVRLWLKSKENGNVLARTSVVLARTRYPWEGNRIGKSERVIPPFEPICVNNEELVVWGRRWFLSNTGLPSQIINQGMPMLTRPMTLAAGLGGATIHLAPQENGGVAMSGESKAHRVEFEGMTRLGPIPVQVKSFLEYDGWYQLHLHFQHEEAVTLDRLELEIPLWPGADTACVQRNELRYGWYAEGESYFGAIPQGTGTVWDSRHLPGGMAPAVFAGNGDMGLWWYTEDPVYVEEGCPDRASGWSFSKENPAIVMDRKAGEVSLHLRFIAVPKVLEPGETLEFAFLPEPVKPLPPGWRRIAWSERGEQPSDPYGHDTSGFRLYGASVDGFELNSEEEYADLKQLFQNGQRTGNSSVYSMICPPYQAGKPVVLYGSGRMTGLGLDAFDTFGGEWLDITSWVPRPDHSFEGKASYAGILWDTPRKLTPVWVNFNRSFADCFIWYHQKLVEKVGINGTYWDNAAMAKIWEIEPQSGRKTWKWDTFSRRELCKRLAVMGWESGREPWWIIHMHPSDFSWVQEVWHIEGNFYAASGRDQIDQVPPDHFRAMTRSRQGPYQKLWPHIPELHSPKARELTRVSPARKRLLQRSIEGLLLSHDVGIYQSSGPPHLPGEIDFYNEKECEFIGYWRTAETAQLIPPQEQVLISIYRNIKMKRAVLVILNAGDDPAAGQLHLNPASLQIPLAGNEAMGLWDLETEQPLPYVSEGYPVRRLARHDYRFLIAEPVERPVGPAEEDALFACHFEETVQAVPPARPHHPVRLEGVSPMFEQGFSGKAVRLAGAEWRCWMPLQDGGTLEFRFKGVFPAGEPFLELGAHWALVMSPGKEQDARVSLALVNSPVSPNAEYSDRPAVLPDDWHHAAISWTPSKIRLFLDGRLADERDLASPLSQPAGYHLAIGFKEMAATLALDVLRLLPDAIVDESDAARLAARPLDQPFERRSEGEPSIRYEVDDLGGGTVAVNLSECISRENVQAVEVLYFHRGRKERPDTSARADLWGESSVRVLLEPLSTLPGVGGEGDRLLVVKIYGPKQRVLYERELNLSEVQDIPVEVEE